MKLQEVPVSENNTEGNYIHYCPGCDQLHMINTKVKNQNNAMWSFDGNFDKPTFSPSVHIFSIDQKGNRNTSCHYILSNGIINFCTDSRHHLAGKQIALPEIPEAFL